MNNPINKQDANGQYSTNVFGTEFTIKEVITTISVNEKGWYLNRYGVEKYESFNDIWDLLENARVDSMSLRSIWYKVTF